jgi:hypothetical protein
VGKAGDDRLLTDNGSAAVALGLWRIAALRRGPLGDSRFSRFTPALVPGLGRGIVAGQSGRLEVDRLALGNVRFGSKADIRVVHHHVRFTPKSGHRLRLSLAGLCWPKAINPRIPAIAIRGLSDSRAA